MSDLDFIWELLHRTVKMIENEREINPDLNVAGWNRGSVDVRLTFDDGKLTGISVY